MGTFPLDRGFVRELAQRTGLRGEESGRLGSMQEGSTPGTGHSCLPGLRVWMGTRGKACREHLMPEHPVNPSNSARSVLSGPTM